MIVEKFPDLKVTYGKGRWSKYIHVGRIQDSRYVAFTPEERDFLINLVGAKNVSNGFCSFRSDEILEEVI